MGNDRAAGPIMELVVEFWPNHYQALYHAGMSRYEMGDFDLAAKHLKGFLSYYPNKDGWTESAQRVLDELVSK